MSAGAPTEPDMQAPWQRLDLVGHRRAEQIFRDLIDRDALSNGWMLVGPAGIGKATLAYRIARAVLTRGRFLDADRLAVDPEQKAVHLINQKCHPDLFVAERQWDEKKQHYAAEITVDNIRNLIEAMTRTSESGRRVAVIDCADDLNRNAANALLKILEEPPAGALVLLLVNAPGRLLPTLRSRCRTVALNPVATEQVSQFVQDEAGLPGPAADRLAAAAGGRPGYALTLAHEDGAAAIALLDDFLEAIVTRRGLNLVAEKLAPKSADDTWRCFRTILQQQLTRAARAGVTGEATDLPDGIRSVRPDRLVAAWETSRQLIEAGDALNSDRGQLILTMGLKMHQAISGRA